jgi:hypothetical protein
VLGANPVAWPKGKLPRRKKKPVLSPVEVSWDGEELEARIEEVVLEKSPDECPKKFEIAGEKPLVGGNELGEDAAAGLKVSNPAGLEGLEGELERSLDVTGVDLKSSPVGASEDKPLDRGKGLREDDASGIGTLEPCSVRGFSRKR